MQKSDVEVSVIGHGTVEGPFIEIEGWKSSAIQIFRCG
jgi:hypothetical protein